MKLFFLDGTPFSNDFIRVVHGGRGDYVELTKSQIIPELKSHFNNDIPNKINENEPYYYYYLEPVGRNEKIYWQIKTVKYADYKIGFYYISPSLLLPFNELHKIVNPLF